MAERYCRYLEGCCADVLGVVPLAPGPGDLGSARGAISGAGGGGQESVPSVRIVDGARRKHDTLAAEALSFLVPHPWASCGLLGVQLSDL